MRFVVTGCTGRMGKELIKAILSSTNHNLIGALSRNSNNMINKDIGDLFNQKPIGLNITNDINSIQNIDTIIDFTSPELSIELSKYSADNNIPLIIGTTGFTDNQLKQITEFAVHTRIFLSYNMSIGINLLAKIIKKAASVLTEEYDAEIYEMHHRNKVDSPSGTALMLGESIAKGRNINFNNENLIFARNEKRTQGKIGFVSLRGGGVVGDHKVIFASDDEIIEFSHKAINRSIFAKGAIKAAEWLVEQPNGLYNMDDIEL